jgi:type I restriction enzyme S subunit
MSDQYVDAGVPFLRSQDIMPGYIDTSSLKFISPEFHYRIRKSRLSPGDVAIVRTGYPGSAAVVPDSLPEANCSDLVIARPSSSLHPRYLAFVLNSPWGKGQVNGRLVGAAQQHFNVKVAQALEIPTPSLETQHRIASILGAYDDLIEVNRRRIAVLEEMARGLFEEWFVRFRFPGHENVAMVETPDGVLPEGWRWGAASDLVLFDPRTRVPREGEKPFIPMGHLDTTTSLIAEPEQREGNSGAKFQNDDTLFARITPCLENGKTGLVRNLPAPDGVGFGSTEFIVLRGGRAGAAFTYCLSRLSAFREHARKSMSGATGRQRARTESVADFSIAVPPVNDLFERFEKIAWPMLELVGQIGLAGQRLAASRDLLLPRLISGQLSVTQAEREMEVAT